MFGVGCSVFSGCRFRLRGPEGTVGWATFGRGASGSGARGHAHSYQAVNEDDDPIFQNKDVHRNSARSSTPHPDPLPGRGGEGNPQVKSEPSLNIRREFATVGASKSMNSTRA